ncbi:DUF6894 family protein [Methylobacterium soli]|uniref:DUF6894 family protein n=1 Tax=Methylobacterium soli TaxID=553447 RepID=UPI0035A24A1C
MLQRLHFRLVDSSGVIEDPIGATAEDIEEAHTEAMAAIEELRLQGELPEDAGEWHLEIRSVSGALLRSIPLPPRDLRRTSRTERGLSASLPQRSCAAARPLARQKAEDHGPGRGASSHWPPQGERS